MGQINLTNMYMYILWQEWRLREYPLIQAKFLSILKNKMKSLANFENHPMIHCSINYNSVSLTIQIKNYCAELLEY